GRTQDVFLACAELVIRRFEAGFVAAGAENGFLCLNGWVLALCRRRAWTRRPQVEVWRNRQRRVRHHVELVGDGLLQTEGVLDVAAPRQGQRHRHASGNQQHCPTHGTLYSLRPSMTAARPRPPSNPSRINSATPTLIAASARLKAKGCHCPR